jgi:hypothetical protein
VVELVTIEGGDAMGGVISSMSMVVFASWGEVGDDSVGGSVGGGVGFSGIEESLR